MADDAQLPPQATGNTLPGIAGDLADLAPIPAPPAELPVMQAALGDQGAADYQALRKSGQQASTVAPAPIPAPPPDVSGAGAPGLAGPQASLLDPLAGALVGAATKDPMAGQKAYKSRLELAAQQQQVQTAIQREFRENASEFYTALVPAAFKQFPGRPDLAASFLRTQAAQRGLNVDPAVLVSLNQDFIDGKLTTQQLNDIIGDPSTPVDTIQRFGAKAKLVNEAIEGRGHAIEATNKALASATAPQEAQLDLTAKTLANDLKQKEVDTYYDTIERKVASEASQRGLKPGTPEFTNYTEARKAQLDAYAKRQIFLNTPLSGRNAEDFNQADRAAKFANSALALLNDPKIANDRGVVEGRLRNLAWRFGFAQSPNEDLYQSLSSLSGLMGSKVYSGGIRNMKWIDKVLEHTLRPGDEVGLVKDKVGVLLKAALEQQQGIINTATTPIGELKPTVDMTQAQGATGTATAPTVVQTPEDAAKLAPGTQFVTPDGQVRVRK